LPITATICTQFRTTQQNYLKIITTTAITIDSVIGWVVEGGIVIGGVVIGGVWFPFVSSVMIDHNRLLSAVR